MVKIRLRYDSGDWLLSMLQAQDANGEAAQNKDLAEQIHESVRLAARIHPWSAQCLPKSIVLCTLLQKMNLDSQLCIGVSKTSESGISSHAWVQHAGDAVCEPESVTEQFVLVQTPV